MIRPDVDELIAFLDSLAKLDPVAMGTLINSRVPCNQELAKHPSVQAGATDCLSGYEVGILGVLNGYAGTIEGGKYNGWGPISAIIEQDGRCTGFVRTEQAATLIQSRSESGVS